MGQHREETSWTVPPDRLNDAISAAWDNGAFVLPSGDGATLTTLCHVDNCLKLRQSIEAVIAPPAPYEVAETVETPGNDIGEDSAPPVPAEVPPPIPMT